MKSEAGRDHVQSVERCLAVIQAFTDGPRFMNLTEVAGLTGLSKPTVRRMLLTLRALGYVDSDGAKFGLTPKVLSLGYAYLSSLSLPGIAQPFLEGLTEELQASTALVTLDGTDVVYVSRVHRHRFSNISLAVGARLPAYVTASGRILLADLSPEAISRFFEKMEIVPLTHATIAHEQGLRDELKRISAQGWAAVDQELEIGRRSAAAPVRDSSGGVIAALSFSCATTEATFDEVVQKAVPRLVATANQISEALGANSKKHVGAGDDLAPERQRLRSI